METNSIVKAIIGVAVIITIVMSVMVPIINGVLDGGGEGATVANPTMENGNRGSLGEGNIQISAWEEGDGTDVYHVAVNGEEVEITDSKWIFISNVLSIQLKSDGFVIVRFTDGNNGSVGADRWPSFDLTVGETLIEITQGSSSQYWSSPRSELSPYFYIDSDGDYYAGSINNALGVKLGPGQYLAAFESRITGSGFMGLAFATWRDEVVDNVRCAPADAPTWSDPSVTFSYTGIDEEGFYVFDTTVTTWTSSSGTETITGSIYPVTAVIPAPPSVEGSTATLIATVPVIIVAGLVIATIGSFIMSRR